MLKKTRLYIRKSPWYVIVIIAALIVALLSVIVGYLYFVKSDSANGRLFIWKICGKIISDNLFFGVGYDNFFNAFADYQSNYFKLGLYKMQEFYNAGFVPFAFNDYLQSFVETGLIGFILFWFLLFATIVALLKSKKKDVLIFTVASSLVLIFVSAMFSYPMQVPTILYFYFIFLGMISSALQ
ncbi:MAG: hypothetical protein HC905_28925, partial [Bacteroidales bacterium]|nr:hypothetical protein [Bacteroidales bacterium]